MKEPTSDTGSSSFGDHYRQDLGALSALVDIAAALWPRLLRKSARRSDSWIALTVSELFADMCRTCASVRVLVQHGLTGDIDTLIRRLMQNGMALVFIVESDSRQRALMYHGHRVSARLKLLKEMRRIGGFGPKSVSPLIEVAESLLPQILQQLPQRVKVEEHWSGSTGLPQAMKKTMRGSAAFATLYRHWLATEPLIGYLEPVEFDRHGDLISRMAPASVSPRERLAEVREALWLAASLVNRRYKLGFAAALAPHRVARRGKVASRPPRVTAPRRRETPRRV